MKKIQHKIAGGRHIKIARELDKEIAGELDEDTRLSLMTVAAQNYFYAGINAIEYVFAGLKNPLHSTDHRSRLSNLYTNVKEFDNKEIYFQYDEVSNKTRRQVVYRAVNGSKYRKLKEFAESVIGEIDD